MRLGGPRVVRLSGPRVFLAGGPRVPRISFPRVLRPGGPGTARSGRPRMTRVTSPRAVRHLAVVWPRLTRPAVVWCLVAGRRTTGPRTVGHRLTGPRSTRPRAIRLLTARPWTIRPGVVRLLIVGLGPVRSTVFGPRVARPGTLATGPWVAVRRHRSIWWLIEMHRTSNHLAAKEMIRPRLRVSSYHGDLLVIVKFIIPGQSADGGPARHDGAGRDHRRGDPGVQHQAGEHVLPPVLPEIAVLPEIGVLAGPAVLTAIISGTPHSSSCGDRGARFPRGRT